MTFLYVAGPVEPTDASVDEVQRCEGGGNHSNACDVKHCYAEAHYYQLWWFWLVWALLFLLSCCCVCYHRRIKHMLQQQRQHEINLMAYREVHNSTSPPFYIRFLPNYLLPDYDEVMNRPPTPPPPYTALHCASTACTTSDQQEAHCPSRQATPVPPVSDPLCSRPSIEDFHSHRGQCHKDSSKPQMGSEQCTSGHVAEPTEESTGTWKQNVCSKGEWREAETSEDKGRNLRRQRHFTGDSGIEVCMCTRGPESCEHKEIRTLQREEHQGDSGEVWESCNLRGDEDQGGIMAEQRAEPLSQPHPHCMYLHTINELEGPHRIETESQR